MERREKKKSAVRRYINKTRNEIVFLHNVTTLMIQKDEKKESKAAASGTVAAKI